MKSLTAVAGLLAIFCGASNVYSWQSDSAGLPAVQQQQAEPMAMQQPQLPPGFPLDAETQQYIEQLLAYWEGTSTQVSHYQCKFTRWQYDQEVCSFRKPVTNVSGENSLVLVAAMISRGSIRFSTPGKGMYEVDEKWSFAGPPEQPGEEPKYERRSLSNPDFPEQEKWICDGLAIYEYDYETRRLYETKLPPEAQGEGLKNSPLPFVFGAKATELLDRYWIRDVTPGNVQDQYWLEAWPKRLNDAQTYSKIEIMLSRDPFLPTAIHMYAPNYNEKSNPSKMVFEFQQREINGTLAGLFDRYWIRPSTPFGWQRVENDMMGEGSPANVPKVSDTPSQSDPNR